jgi:plasmid stabilization system protein ParE
VTKKYKIKITQSAQSDIGSIWGYISKDNPLNAKIFIDELESQVYTLSQLPERNPVIPEGGIFQVDVYRHKIYKGYRIIYRIDSENVYVLRVFHGSKLLDIASL